MAEEKGNLRIVCIDNWINKNKPWAYLVNGKMQFVPVEVDEHEISSWLVPFDVGIEMLLADRRRFKLYQHASIDTINADGTLHIKPWYYDMVDGKPQWRENDGGLPVVFGDGEELPKETKLDPTSALRKSIMEANGMMAAGACCEKTVDEVFGENKGRELTVAYMKALDKKSNIFSKHEFPTFAQTIFKLLDKVITWDEAVFILSEKKPKDK